MTAIYSTTEAHRNDRTASLRHIGVASCRALRHVLPSHWSLRMYTNMATFSFPIYYIYVDVPVISA